MFKPASFHTRVEQLGLTKGEIVLLVTAVALCVAALATVVQTPLGAVALLLAAAAVSALIHERASTRRQLHVLAEQLNTTGPLAKLEVHSATGTHALGQALNRAIQRSRAEALDLPASAAPPLGARDADVAVLSLGVSRDGLSAAAYSERLSAVAQTVRRASADAGVELYVQADGTLLLIFGAHTEQPMRLSLHHALNVALTLSAHDPLIRFGLSCGNARVCVLPGIGTTYIGPPLEDALRLARMAVSWNEYQLLCAEPIALLARQFASHRTTLELTHAAAPTLPVYALALPTAPIALSA